MKLSLPHAPRYRVIAVIIQMVAIWGVAAIPASAQNFQSCNCGVLLSQPYAPAYPLSRFGMPPDVIAGYNWYDSVVKNYTTLQVEKGLRYRPTLSDTVKRGLRYLYAIKDYNPLLFLQYQDADTVRFTGLKAQPFGVWMEMLHHLRSITSDDTTGMHLRTLIHASYVLQVKVHSVTYATDTLSEGAPNVVVVKAIVLDTIKGKVFPACTIPMESRKGRDPVPQSGEPCITFEYRREWFRHDSYQTRPMSPDSVLGSNWMKVDSQYVVFLNILPVGRDSNNVIATISPVKRGNSAGMYRIEGGNVKDSNNDFGWGGSVPVATFISRIQGKINEITSW